MQERFSQRLAALMKNLGLGPFDLSLLTKIREANIRKWLAGTALPIGINAGRLAVAFEMSIEELVEGTELDPTYPDGGTT